MLTTIFYSLLALDQTVAQVAADYGPWVYAFLFAIIFAETGLVVMPLLPGDSLLFIAGAITALAGLNVHLFVAILCAAAILGDAVNYFVGSRLGMKAFERKDSRIFKQEYLLQTQAFYEKYGAFSIVMGRFVPIVRTFVPFLAGVAQMPYRTFLVYNVIGGAAWIASLTYAGYLFGNIAWVRNNLSLIVIGIVAVSVLPIVIKVWQEHRRSKRSS